MGSGIIGFPIELGLHLLDIWPNFSNPLGRAFVWLILFLNLPFQFWDAYNKRHNTIAMMANCTTSVATLLTFVKFNVIWAKRRYMVELISDMMEDWSQTKGKNTKRMILSKRTHQMQVFCAWYMGVYTAQVIIFALDAILTYILLPVNRRKLIMPVYYPFLTQNSPYFEGLVLLNFVEVVVAAGGNAFTETLIVSLALHVGTRVAFMKLEIEKFAEEFLRSEKTIEQQVSKGIEHLVKQHMRILDFVEKIEEVFAYVSLSQCLFSTLIICAVGYCVLTSLESEVLDKVTLIKFSIYSWNKLMQIFCFCFAGEYLSTQTSSISTVFYNCQWYNLKPSDRKMIMFLISKCQRPITITAGKFVDLQLVSFTTIVKTAASYLSVLRQAT